MNKLVKINVKKCAGILLFLAMSHVMFAQSITVTGRVVDHTSVTMPGVNVVVKGTTIGTSTDMNGMYSISVPDQDAVLVFSFVGFVQQELIVGNRNVIDITLLEDSQMIDEVVVVGFGKQRKQTITGSISTISPRELRVPSSNLSSAFAGRLAGMIAVQRSGEPGADGANFWIRGISTFSGSTAPLIFIDGIESSSADMNALPPEVIENFSVLKDASATALYGARGANGVILITTRQGRKNERTRINVRLETQMTQPTQVVKLADGVTYMEKYNEALTTRGSNIMFEQSKIDGTRNNLDPYLYPNIDWQSFLFSQWAYNQTANINVAGGGNRATYFMNVKVNNDNGMLKNNPHNKFKNNISQQKYTMQGNIAVDLTSTTRAFLRLNSIIVNYTGPHSNVPTIYSRLFITPSVLFPAYIPAEMNPDADHVMFGNQAGGPIPIGGGNLYYNAYADMVSGYTERSESTNTVSFEMEQDLKHITQGLKARGLISFKNWTRTNVSRFYRPFYYSLTVDEDAPSGYRISTPLNTNGTTALEYPWGLDNMAGDRLMNIQASLEYGRTFAEKHEVGGLLVYLQRDFNSNTPRDYYASLATRNQGVAGRITYAYDNRYLAEANFGYNGSENFQKGNRFGFFPSIALGYNISNESFWEPIKDVVTDLKFRGSWGIVGNASIGADGRFPYLSFVDLKGRSFTFGDDWQTSLTGARITRYGAEGAKWEEGTKKNLGLDLSLFRSLDISVDVYSERREGIFMRYNTTPVESGISRDLRPFANLGVVKNEGFDASMNYNRAYLNNDLVVSLRGTFTFAKNTLIDRDEPISTPAHQSEIGKSLNLHNGLIAMGLFKDQAEIDNSPGQDFSAYLPGDIKYMDLDGNGIIDSNDQTRTGYPSVPQVVWGTGLSVAYKNFEFSMFFQGTARTSLMMGNIHPFSDEFSQLYQFIADDHWGDHNQNPYAAYPRLTARQGAGQHNNHRNSTYWMRDASFFRLKNIEIAYNYKFARLYLSGQNVFTSSKFKHWDPEVGSGNGLSYPPLRLFSVGLQFQF